MVGQDETPGSRRRQSPEDLGSFLRRPGRPLPPAIGVGDAVRRIVELHEGDAGCTFNTYYGHVTGTRLYAVSVYPERGRVVPGRSLDPHVVGGL